MASLNSPRALGREAVMPLLPMRALRPCRWWNRSSSVLSNRICRVDSLSSQIESSSVSVLCKYEVIEVCFPACCSRTENSIFHHIFTQPGPLLLAMRCIYLGKERDGLIVGGCFRCVRDLPGCRAWLRLPRRPPPPRLRPAISQSRLDFGARARRGTKTQEECQATGRLTDEAHESQSKSQ